MINNNTINDNKEYKHIIIIMMLIKRIIMVII